MPIVPPAVGSPYPVIELVMNLARARVNDASNDIAGDLLTDDAPYAQTFLSSAWRWIQSRLYSAGGELAKKEITLYGLPAQASMDTANQGYVTWLGCSDGVYQYENPVLPQDLVQPLSIWRRQTGGVQTTFSLMKQADDGLPRFLNYDVYDWRQDGLYFYPPTFSQDLQIRYYGFYPDLDITMPKTLVPMMMCENCLAARIAFEYTSARGSTGTAQMAQLAEDEFATIAQRSSLRKQRTSFRRRPYGGRRESVGRWPMYQNL